MRISYCLPVMVALVWGILPASTTIAGDVEEELAALEIRSMRDAAGRIIKVELPKRASDEHIEALLQVPTITEIRAPDCWASPAAVASLKELPALSAVHLEHLTEIYFARGLTNADAYAKALRGVRTLETLSLADTSLSTASLIEICDAHGDLRELNISQTGPILQLALPKLLQLRKLETLNMSNMEHSFSEEMKYPGLVIDHRKSIEIERLATLPYLRRLYVSGFRIDGNALYPFGCNCQLELLSVHSRDLRHSLDTLLYLHDCNPELGVGRNIIEKLIHRSDAGKNGVERIYTCVYTNFLQVPHNLLGDLNHLELSDATDLAFLAWLPKLKYLKLDPFVMDRRELLRLHNASQIEVVQIGRVKVDVEMVETLLSIRSLKQFGFNLCEIDVAALAKIRKNAEGGRISISPRP